MKRYIRCSDDSNAYSKWYDMMEIADPDKLDEYAKDDEYIVILCNGGDLCVFLHGAEFNYLKDPASDRGSLLRKKNAPPVFPLYGDGSYEE